MNSETDEMENAVKSVAGYLECDYAAAPTVCQAAIQEWQERRRQEWQDEAQRRDQARAEQDKLWWQSYNRYINSAEWLAIRSKVIKRANRICEGCGENSAWHVHHCTYKNAFDPFMFELVALCEPCHSRLHGRSVGEEAA